MKRNNSISIAWQLVVLALMVFLCGFLEPAYCQTNGTVLLLQQTSAESSMITPGPGVHHFESGTEVTLTAIPRPGYQFIYWLGDVSDSTANSTIVYLDAPKIVLAVFEQSEYEFLFAEESSQSGWRFVRQSSRLRPAGIYRRRGQKTAQADMADSG